MGQASRANSGMYNTGECISSERSIQQSPEKTGASDVRLCLLSVQVSTVRWDRAPITEVATLL